MQNKSRRGPRKASTSPFPKPPTYKERVQIWDELLDLHAAGTLSKCAVTVAYALMFGFTNMKTGQCNPSLKKLRLSLCPRFSRASIFRALDALEEAGYLKRHAKRQMVHKFVGGRRIWKAVQGASWYQFALKQTVAMKAMAKKALDLVKHAAAVAVRKVWAPVLPKLSGSQVAPVPSENLYRSFSFEKGGTEKGWSRLEAALARLGSRVATKVAEI